MGQGDCMGEPEPSLTAASVQSAVDGDTAALALVAVTDQNQLLAVAAGSPPVVSRRSAMAVLNGLSIGSISGEQAQAWASFVRHGFIEGASGPIRPLNIEYDKAADDAIVEVVGRLDQIGDEVDGDLPSPAELAALVASLDS
jgi:hypothetical protein